MTESSPSCVPLFGPALSALTDSLCAVQRVARLSEKTLRDTLRQKPLREELSGTPNLRAQSCGLFLAKNSCEKRILGPELGASLKITLR